MDEITKPFKPVINRHGLQYLSADHPVGLLQQLSPGGKEIEPWLVRRASADLSIFPGICYSPVNSTSQWRTLILVNSLICESMRWLSQFYCPIPGFQVRARIIPRIGNKTIWTLAL
jgi:hypothetical protein